MSQINNRNTLPPSRCIEELQNYLLSHILIEQSVLDLGCASGRNTKYLSLNGNKVVGMSLVLDEVKEAVTNNQTDLTSYIVADVRNPPFTDPFDIVVCNEVLHMMPKEDSIKTLKIARRLTKPGGINAVSGYLLSDEVLEEKNRLRCFQPDELRQSYVKAGWMAIHYSEIVRPTSLFHDRELINSVTSLIAIKPR